MASTAATIESRLPHRLAETRARAQAESNVGIGHLRFPRLKLSILIPCHLLHPFLLPQSWQHLSSAALTFSAKALTAQEPNQAAPMTKSNEQTSRREDRATLSGAVATFYTSLLSATLAIVGVVGVGVVGGDVHAVVTAVAVAAGVAAKTAKTKKVMMMLMMPIRKRNQKNKTQTNATTLTN